MREADFLRHCGRLRRGLDRLQPERSVQQVLRHIGRITQRYHAAADAFERVCPADLAGCCRVEEFRDGRLTVAVVHPAALFELRRRQATLLRHMQDLCRGLAELRLVLAGEQSEAADRPPRD